MIKLIATDIDGTLVKDSSPAVDEETNGVIKELIAKGYIFVVASGRQYYSIKHLFREIQDDIVFLAENGAHIVYKGEVLSVTPMNRELIEGVISEFRAHTPPCELLVSTVDGSLMETNNQTFIDLIEHSYHNKNATCKDVLLCQLDMIKLSLYQRHSVREIAETHIIPKWGQQVKATMAGEEWVDIMDKTVDKGKGIQFLQDYFNITKEGKSRGLSSFGVYIYR